MKNSKKLTAMTSLAVVAATVVPAVASADTVNFTDIGSSYAQTAIQDLASKGILNGVGGTSFNPTGNISRQDFAIVLAKALNLNTTTASATSFTDVASYAAPYVAAAHDAGLIAGYSNTTFGGSDNLSRQDMATMFIRALKYTNGYDATGKASNLKFSDNASIASYAQDSVGAAVELGLITGYSDGNGGMKFDPTATAERQAVALVADKFLNVVAQQKTGVAALTGATLVDNNTITLNFSAAVTSLAASDVTVTASASSAPVTVQSATLSTDGKSATVKVATLASGTAYTVSYKGVNETVTTATVNAPSLSNMTFSGQAIGDGSVTSPAVSNGNAVTVSTKLTDANGNPVSGINASLEIKSNGSQPTVLTNGMVPSTTGSGNDVTYQIPTDATGTATAQLTVAAGSAASYTMQFSAPYTVNQQTVTGNTAYLEFVPANSTGISPFGTSGAGNAYQVPVSTVSNETAGLVPVTVTLPPLNGAPQANVKVDFAATAATGAYFANAQGLNVASGTFSVYTNSNGQATVYVNNNQETTSSVEVTASIGGSQVADTYLSWGTSGIVNGIDSTYYATGVTGGKGTVTAPYTANANNNVTITAKAEDVLGNPVANAQLLITDALGHESDYVTSGGTKTTFPVATPVSGANVDSTGAPFGQIVTTDSNGNFNFTVTDGAESDIYNVYVVNNAQVSSSTAVASFNVNFQAATTSVTNVGVATQNGLLSSYDNNSDAPVTSLSNVQATNTPLDGTAADSVVGGAGVLAQVEAGAFDDANHDFLSETTNTGASVTYQVSADKSGFIGSVDGVLLDGNTISAALGLPNKPSTVTVSVSPVSAANAGTPTTSTWGATIYQVKVNNVQIGAFDTAGHHTAGLVLATDLTGDTHTGTLSSALNIGLGDTKVETSTLTVTTGTGKATAAVQFTAGAVSSVSASPVVASPVDGTSQTVTLTAEDANGNPVANAPITLAANTTPGLWVTAVNGTTLQQQLAVGTNNLNEPTPIPLFDTTVAPVSGGTTQDLHVGYSSVVIPGAVTWGDNGKVTFTTDANGKVTFTLLNNNVSYYNGTTKAVAVDSTDYAGTLLVGQAQGTSTGFFIKDNQQTMSGSTADLVESTIKY